MASPSRFRVHNTSKLQNIQTTNKALFTQLKVQPTRSVTSKRIEVGGGDRG